MLNLFAWTFFVILWGASACFAFVIFLSVLSVTTMLLRALFAPLRVLWIGLTARTSRPQARTDPTDPVKLDDPVGVLSLISHRCQTPMFLKDLVFLEADVFGSNSKEVSDWFYAAERDPRPEVCGSFAIKILLKLAGERQTRIHANDWDQSLESKWKRGAPLEFRKLLGKKYDAA